MDRRGPVYAQGTAPPEARWLARAYGVDGGVRGIAKRMREDEAKRLAERWMTTLPGTVRAEAVEGTGAE